MHCFSVSPSIHEVTQVYFYTWVQQHSSAVFLALGVPFSHEEVNESEILILTPPLYLEVESELRVLRVLGRVVEEPACRHALVVKGLQAKVLKHFSLFDLLACAIEDHFMGSH